MAQSSVAEDITELTQEQAQQIVDNFQALRDSLDQGKEKIEELQQKISRIKQTTEWLNDKKHGKELRAALDKLEKSGLSSKLQNIHNALDTISRSADHISNKAEEIKGKYDQVKEFYDKWHPDRDNPVRPLELVANALGELESIVQSLDPSPDNVLTKPITEFIDYYKQSSEAFAGALTRLQAKIEERRQNCIGTGCENYSVMAEAFVKKFPNVGPAWQYRPLQEGEIWYDGAGRAFLWWQDKWQELQGGVGRFEEVYHGWKLAHGNVIATSNLIGRVNNNYETVVAAKQRAGKYWIIVNSSNSCHGDLFKALKKRGTDRDRIFANANNDRNTFIARYMFLQSARGNIDKLVKAFDDTLLVRGVVVNDKGNGVTGASIKASSSAGTTTASSEAGGWFSLLFNLKPDSSSKQNAKVSVSHNEHQSSESEQRLWHKCEDWRITLNSGDESQQNEALAELQTIRNNALAKASEVETACQTLRNDNAQISSALQSLPKPQSSSSTNTSNVNNELAELKQQADRLAQESDTLAKALAESSKQLSGRVNNVCEGTGQLEATSDDRRKQQLYQQIKVEQEQAQRALGPMQSGFPSLNVLAEQANTIKTRAKNVQANLGQTSTQAKDSPELQSLRQRHTRAQQTNANVKTRAQELSGIRTRAALILHKQATATNKQQLEQLFAEITAARDRTAGCVENTTAQFDALTTQIGQYGQKRTTEVAKQDPANISAQLQGINSQADEAINNATIAQRFFNLSKMEGKINEGAACLARAEQTLQQRQQQNALLIALNNCDLHGAEREIARGNADVEQLQRYEALKQQENTVTAEMQRVSTLRRECKLKQAENVLSNAVQLSSCEATQNKVMQTLLVVKGEVRKSAASNQAWNAADSYYKQGDFQNAYHSLQRAKQNAVCPQHHVNVDNGFRQVNQKLQEANNKPPKTANTTHSTAETVTSNPVCQRYQQEMARIGQSQQRLAAQARSIRTEDEAAAMQAQVMANSRRSIEIIDQSRAAGCHDQEIPAEFREAMGMPANQGGQSANTNLQCQAPRVAGILRGQPACVCPGDLFWSDKRQQCVKFGELMGESGGWDDLDKALSNGTKDLGKPR